jgi:hypothetical protein
MAIKFKPNIFYRCSELFMALGRFIKKSVIKICHKLFAVLRKALKQSVDTDVLQIIFNSRDSSYHREPGGYHSVELSQPKGTSNGAELNCYGGSYAGMARELDFDFSSATSFVLCSQPNLIIARINAIFNLWLNDFLNYLKYGVFYPIKLNTC